MTATGLAGASVFGGVVLAGGGESAGVAVAVGAAARQPIPVTTVKPITIKASLNRDVNMVRETPSASWRTDIGTGPATASGSTAAARASGSAAAARTAEPRAKPG